MATSPFELGEPNFKISNYDYGERAHVNHYSQIDDKPNDEEILLWDLFKCTERPPQSGSMMEKRWYEIMLRFIKTILYGILFVIILCGCVIAKVTILFAVSQLCGKSASFSNVYQGRYSRETHTYDSTLPRESQTPWMWCIIFAFSIPEVLNFLRFIWNCFFVDIRLPKIKYIVLITVIEILHTSGMALLFLVALPNLDVLQAAVCLTCICIVPAVLGFFSLPSNKENMNTLLFYLPGNILALLGQIGGLILFTYLAFQRENNFLPWIFPIALILSSLRWWSNYVSPGSRFGFIRRMSEYRRNLQAYRPILIGYTSLLRILVFLITALIIAFWKDIEPKLFFEGFNMKRNNVIAIKIDNKFINELPFYVFFMNAVSGICIYNCGKFACRTLMQGFGFALPLILAVPMTVITLWLTLIIRDNNVCAPDDYDCMKNSVIYKISDIFFVNTGIKNYSYWYIGIWIVLLLSQLWIIRHVWSTRNERLSATDKIFCIFSYDSLIIDQSLAMSKWREEPEDDDYSDIYLSPEEVLESTKHTKNFLSIKKEDHVTKIYACATMWHETAEEMKDFLNSILRLDRDQCIMQIPQKRYGIMASDYYKLEVHIIFDDAFKCTHGCNARCLHDGSEIEINDYVIRFVKTLEKIISDRKLKPLPPTKYPTPYGGRLLWTLPEGTKMYVHLKDKNRIRTRKRWSQVMYMYYLLGYRLMQKSIEVERKEVIAENTYILTLDGDIDFRPSAVRTLVDRMKVNKDVGSACGRIHPIGKGPLVWFQKFEYAIGHWLQKSTEHTIGCVLCSPGCFALFRAKALMDFNVMRKYATMSSEARHFIQYDQGEDRWLCTLILQRGYKVEYSAASDAYTHAPETFNEFFIQRRRWIPSTVANIFDLLETAKETKKINRDISWPYISYQYILMGSTILGPGTIFLMLVGAFVASLQIENWPSFGFNLIPIVIFCTICYFCKEKTQLTAAAIITCIYGLVMIVVLVGIMVQITDDGWLAPTSLLFFIIAGELIVTGILHPLECTCLIYGVIYYVTVPSMYMVLIIFSLFNMHNITWGTRDAPKPVLPEEEQQVAMENNPANEEKQVSNTKMEKGPSKYSFYKLFRRIYPSKELTGDKSLFNEINLKLSRIEDRINDLQRVIDGNSDASHKTNQNRQTDNAEETVNSDNLNAQNADNDKEFEEKSQSNKNSDDDSGPDEDEEEDDTESVGRNDDKYLVSPNWLRCKDLGNGEVEYLQSNEEKFWKQFIERYLEPIDKDDKREAELANEIKLLRNQYVFKFFMVNALFVITIFLMQLHKDKLHMKWPLGVKNTFTFVNETYDVIITREHLRLEPIGCIFILGFCVVLLIQFIAMLFHRFDTFSHIMAKVNLYLYWNCCSKEEDLSEEQTIERNVEKIIKELQREIDSEPKIEEHNSTIPPRKRQTLHQAISSNQRQQPYADTFSNRVEKNLDDAGRHGGNLAKRIPQRAWQALRRRHTTILQNKTNDDDQSVYYATTNNPVNNERLKHRKPTRSSSMHQYAFENPAFVTETEGNERV